MGKIDWKKYNEFNNNREKLLRLYFKKNNSDEGRKVHNFLRQIERLSADMRKDNYKSKNIEPNFNEFGNWHSKYYGQFNNAFYNGASSRKQRAVIKMRYATTMRTHKNFLNNYLVQKDKKEILDKPELFGNISKKEYLKKINRNCFKFIFSPEKQLENDSLKMMTKLLVTKLEEEIGIGCKFDWLAAIHNNTPHKHTHILINGVDTEGHPIRFKRDFLKQGIYKVTSEFMTSILGERTDEEISLATDNTFCADRFTENDKLIKDFQEPNDNIDYPTKITPYNQFLSRRLDYLKELDLAKYNSNGYYELENNWDEELRITGRYNTFLTVKKDLKKNNIPYKLQFYDKEIGTIRGRVFKTITMNDEDCWNNAICVVDENNNAYYIPLFKENTECFNKEVEISLKKNSKTPTLKYVKNKMEGGLEFDTTQSKYAHNILLEDIQENESSMEK